jgi:hypothetical protein
MSKCVTVLKLGIMYHGHNCFVLESTDPVDSAAFSYSFNLQPRGERRRGERHRTQTRHRAQSGRHLTQAFIWFSEIYKI